MIVRIAEEHTRSSDGCVLGFGVNVVHCKIMESDLNLVVHISFYSTFGAVYLGQTLSFYMLDV
jgi:hypothetical protein